MLLQKTGWRLKQLISTTTSSRRTNSIDCAAGPNSFLDPNDLAMAAAALELSPKARSMFSNRPSSEDSVLFRSNSPFCSSGRTGKKRWVGCMDAESSSSASSLCSCDECGGAAEPLVATAVAISRTKASEDGPAWKPRHSSQTSQISDSSSGSVSLIIQKDGKDNNSVHLAENVISTDKEAQPRSPSLAPSPIESEPEMESVFDLLEAIASGSDYRSKRASSSPVPSSSPEPTAISPSKDSVAEDVEQLIQEVDDAFKAVGTALADAKGTAELWEDINKEPYRQSPNVNIPKSLKKKSSRASMVREPVVTKTSKMKATRKKKMAGKKTATRYAAAMNQKWHVSGNVADILGVFKSIEVDEMLTDERRKLVEEQREEQRKRLAQLEAERAERANTPDFSVMATPGLTEETVTPVDPFYLQEISSRLPSAESTPDVSAGKRASFARLSLDETAGRKLSDASIDTIINRRSMDDGQGTPRGLGIHPTPRPQPLPSIPELPRITLTDGEWSANSIQRERPKLRIPVNEDLVLPSTPYSQTSPRFRHGSIRLVKSERLRNDDLDWTAYQMAISGGTGDYLMEGFSLSDGEVEDQELDELALWLDEFGITDIGGLREEEETTMIPGTGSPAQQQSCREYEVSPESIRRDSPSQFSDLDTPGVELDVDGELRIASSRASMETASDGPDADELSLPPSPMVQLMGGDEEEIPMGFNLNHDLGDFLKWTNHLDGFTTAYM